MNNIEEQDLNRRISSYLANRYWMQTNAFSQIGLGPDLKPDDAYRLVYDEIEKIGFYEVSGEWIGMGNTYTMRISKVYSNGENYKGMAYELKIAGGENHITIVARFKKLENIFAPATLFRQLIEYASRSYSYLKIEGKANSSNDFPIGYHEDGTD